LALAVTAALTLAQEPLYTLKIDVPVVLVDAAVFGPDNKPITTLNETDFVVLEDGVPQQIRSFSSVSAPYNILLLFDRSGSTESRWNLMQTAVGGFLDNLRKQDRAAVAAFDADFEMLSGWKDSPNHALSVLEELLRPRPESSGVTDLYRALERAAGREFRDVKGRRCVIVLTDGRDVSLYRQIVNLNRTPGVAEDRDFQKTLRTIVKDETPVYFIAVNTDQNLDSTEPGADYLRLRRLFPDSPVPLQFVTEARLRMETVAGASGGQVFYPKRLQDLIPLYGQISRDLSSSYSLGYTPSGRSARTHRIEVRVKDPALRVVQSRNKY
jgi:VWFA-related protein